MQIISSTYQSQNLSEVWNVESAVNSMISKNMLATTREMQDPME